MQTIISQFISILKFNNYFILDRLRQTYNQQKMKEILDKIMDEYKYRLSQQYEILWKVNVEHMDHLIFIYETQTNLQAGRVHLYQNGQLDCIFNKEDAKNIQIVAIYHKIMPFEEIVRLVSQKKSSPIKKYRNKNLDRIIQVNENQIRTPQKRLSPEQKMTSQVKRKQEIKGNKTVRKLMIVSQSQSMQVEPQKSYINLQSDESIREDIIVQSLLLKNHVRYQKVNQQLKQKQNSSIKQKQGFSQRKQKQPIQSHIFKTVKKSNKKIRSATEQKQIQNQSLFMLKWLNKIKIDG